VTTRADATGVRKPTRRRGDALHAAIYQAALDELAEVGYARLTMERVAERAGTGKAALYRRWPSKVELVMDAVSQMYPDPAVLPETGTLRGDLLAALRLHAGLLAGPAGEALRGLLSDVLRDPERTFDLRARSKRRGGKVIAEAARRAVERGEIDAASVTPVRLEAGGAMLRQHFLFHGGPIPDEAIVEIVDELMVPLLRLGPGDPSTS
jgi:AcrR family transcriptional regulator